MAINEVNLIYKNNFKDFRSYMCSSHTHYLKLVERPDSGLLRTAPYIESVYEAVTVYLAPCKWLHCGKISRGKLLSQCACIIWKRSCQVKTLKLTTPFSFSLMHFFKTSNVRTTFHLRQIQLDAWIFSTLMVVSVFLEEHSCVTGFYEIKIESTWL
jgi:hypothetical protein